MTKTLKILVAIVLATTLVFCFAACGKEDEGFKRASGSGDTEEEQDVIIGEEAQDDTAEEPEEEPAVEPAEEPEEEPEVEDEADDVFASSTPDSIVDYIKSNGELEEGIYDVSYIADEGEFISVSYDTETGAVEVSILANDESSSWYHLVIPEDGDVYDVTYAFDDDEGDSHMINGAFEKGLDLENDYDEIELSWYAVGDVFVEEEFDDEQTSTAKMLLSMGARFCALYPDVYIFGTEGLSIMDAYGLVA